jgi:glucose/arabinose dehydrogenase
MRLRAILAAVPLSLLAAAPAAAAPTLVPVGTFAQPVHVAGPPGDATRLFVVEKAGRVQVVVNGQKAATPFLDATSVVNSAGEEQGLLSIAFPREYATSGLFYVFYTGAGGDLVVREGTRSAADPNRGELGRTLFSVPHPGETNHNGGQLAFGPDGALYVGTGDGGGQGDPGNDAQRLDSNLGKILRVDPRGSAGPSIWALGLRNPWRFSFDRTTGTMVIGDVGGDLNEEVDIAPANGGNFGWVNCEGTSGDCSNAAFVAPALNLPHTNGYSGVIGGFVVRDSGLPSLNGRYVFGDLAKDRLLSAALGVETAPRTEETLPVSGPSSFGEDACGHVYVASLQGPVHQIREGAGGLQSCPASPGPGPVTPPADTAPCVVKAARKGTQRILRRGKRLRLTLTANEACAVTLRSRRFRTKRVTLRASVRRVVRLKPTKKGLRKLRRVLVRSDRHRLHITVRISARDAAGNASSKRIRRTVR